MDEKDEKIDFECAMSKLEQITVKLEDENESLENSINLYQEGVSLINYCMEELCRAEQRIRVVDTNNTSLGGKDDV